VLEELSEKLIRRHPHVFAADSDGTNSNLSSKEVLRNWAKIKVEQEGRKPKDSLLDEVSRSLPPLDRAWKLQKKAAKAGFDWPDAAGVIAKIKEELQETEAAIADSMANGAANKIEEELGDLLFSVVNLCRFFDIEPSVALQRTNIKFTERFKHVEKRMKETGQQMNAQNLGVMDQYWNEAKSNS
jgi:tetrapyrrole methylase family protein/MazG family protein